MIDIGYGSKNEVEKKLSNFNPISFVFDGIMCSCLEGPLQAFKCPDPITQIHMCSLSGKAAKMEGQTFNHWQERQTLYWLGREYIRSSQDYQDLLDRLYDAAFLASDEFRQTLKKSGCEKMVHTIGSHDSHQTVLTVTELTSRLYRLRDLLRH